LTAKITIILGVAETAFLDYNDTTVKNSENFCEGGDTMEWIRISNNKLKIMLTAEDAARYALCPDTADYADSVTRRAFRAILTDMRGETGFDAADDKIYIQMYPSREGGCELFVTKMGIELTPKRTATSPYKAKSAGQTRQRRLALCFSGLEDLLGVCRRLLTNGFRGKSSAFLDEGGRYWLLITDNGEPLRVREDYRFTLEYGELGSYEVAETLLSEHGKEICRERAVQTLGKL